MTAFEVLRPLFEPRSIAVVGVSRSRKQGAIFLLGLLDPGFQGNVYVVNPAATEIMGVRSYPTISALPERPDLAVLVLPVDPAIEVVRQCAEAGVPGAALFTAGFNEAGTPEGNARARALLDAAGGRTRLIGPNGMGIYNPARGIAMFPGMPAKVGGVGLLSQSGSLVQLLVRAVTERGLGFSKAVSMGNQLDLDAADYLDYFADDPDTRVIGGYLEGVPDGRRFQQSLRRAAARKPVVLWKVGRMASGARAAASHTGQLAGEHQIVAAMALDGHESLGRRLAIVNGPGGPAVSASDACEEVGLCLAALTEQTTRELRELVAAAGTSVRNPVDIGMVIVDATRIYGGVLRVALADPEVDAALVIGGDAADPQAFSEMLVEASRKEGKPVLHVVSGDFGTNSTGGYLADRGVAFAPSAERVLRAYARLALR
jgi:acetyltransferase